MYFILPQSKSVSLERMGKIIGRVDAVEAGEERRNGEKVEVMRMFVLEQSRSLPSRVNRMATDL